MCWTNLLIILRKQPKTHKAPMLLSATTSEGSVTNVLAAKRKRKEERGKQKDPKPDGARYLA